MRKNKTYLLHTFLSVVLLLQGMPLIIVLFNSFRTDVQIKQSPVGLPTQFNINNYVTAWDIGGYGLAYLNSIFVSIITTILIIIMAMLMGFILAKTAVRIKNSLVIYFGVSMSIPLLSYMAPVYYRFSNYGLIDNHIGIILIYTAVNLSFNILLARTYILGIPNEICESATIDGCNTKDIFLKMIMPLSKPIITTIALISFVSTWNEFTVANTFLQSKELKTVSTRYVLFVTERGSQLDMIFTAAVISMLPIVIVFILLQNYFVDGITSGSVKG